jgi:hypothetical protein
MPKSLPERFFMKPDYRVAVIGAPAHFTQELLAPLPAGVTIDEAATCEGLPGSAYDIIITFVTDAGAVDAAVKPALALLAEGGYLWTAYPKGGAKAAIPTDLNRDSLWALVVPYGYAAVHQIRIDDTWSGLRFKQSPT